MELRTVDERREDFQEYLKSLFDGVEVYYMPPENVRMSYPCFVIKLDHVDNLYSNGQIYSSRIRLSVTYITKHVDDYVIGDMLNANQYASFDRVYTSDNLRHYVFTVYLV